MFRPSFIAAFALVLIVTLPTLASADECICLPTEMAIVTTSRVFQSVEVGPLFSSDGATLTSRGAFGGSARMRRAERRARVLVCVSPNDPRCSPRDGGPDHGPQLADGARYASIHAQTPSVRQLATGLAPRSLEIHGARSGVRDRIERPPRA